MLISLDGYYSINKNYLTSTNCLETEIDISYSFFFFEERILVMNIYVGNLPNHTNEDEIKELFEQYGEVHSVKLITDRETGRLRGFGFVEMEQNGGRNAIEELDGHELDGQNLKVNEARERRPRRSNYRRPY